MAQYKKRRKTKRKKVTYKTFKKLSATLVVILCLMIGLSEKFDLSFLKTWQDVYITTGMREDVNTSAASDFEVHTIDVGQGDATLIRQGESFALIDAGIPENSMVLTDYLKKAGVEKLDCVVMTHPHADHIGGMVDIINNFEISLMIMPDYNLEPAPTTKVFENVLKALTAKEGIAIETATIGREIPIGTGMITVVGIGVQGEGLNNISVSTRFTQGDVSYLNTGDLETVGEKALMAGVQPIQSDIYKGGHHGSNTSSSKGFMDIVKPDYVAVSCGEDNDYGHPHKKIVSRYDDMGAKTLRTDERGTITYFVNNGEITVEVEK